MAKIAPHRIVSFASPGMRRVMAVMAEANEPLDGRQIADSACIAHDTFRNTYRHLLLHAEMIHVAAWRHNTRGPFVPLYMAGPGKEAPKPEKIDQLARARAWKERTGYNAARKAERRLKNPPDRALAALLGINERKAA